MKKLISTATGGQALVWNDFRWGTNGLTESLASLITAVLDPSVVTILLGCNRTVTGSVVTISEGAIAYNGEVFRVLEHSFPTGGLFEFWEFDTLYDPIGLKVLNNTGVSTDTYQEAIYKVSSAAAQPLGTTLYNSLGRYMNRLTQLLVRDTWNVFNTQTVDPGEINAGTYQMSVKKDLNGFVHIKGLHNFEDFSLGEDYLVGTLPIGYRPAVEREFAISKKTGTDTAGTSIFLIKPNGEIRLVFANIGFVNLLDFGQIVPFEAAV